VLSPVFSPVKRSRYACAQVAVGVPAAYPIVDGVAEAAAADVHLLPMSANTMARPVSWHMGRPFAASDARILDQVMQNVAAGRATLRAQGPTAARSSTSSPRSMLALMARSRTALLMWVVVISRMGWLTGGVAVVRKYVSAP